VDSFASFHTCVDRSEATFLCIGSIRVSTVGRHEHSEMLCLWRDGSAATAEEMEFSDQFARECAFIATLSTITPSSISWGDRVDEDRLTHSSDSEGD
jgi:hypothetical protein